MMNASSFDPVYVTEGIALNVPLALSIAGLVIATIASVAVAVVRRLRRRTAAVNK
jgi:hypothetical protein